MIYLDMLTHYAWVKKAKAKAKAASVIEEAIERAPLACDSMFF